MIRETIRAYSMANFTLPRGTSSRSTSVSCYRLLWTRYAQVAPLSPSISSSHIFSLELRTRSA